METSIFVLEQPIETLQDLTKFVSRPLDWSERTRTQALDAAGEMVVKRQEFVDRLGNWMLSLDFEAAKVTLQALRYYVSPTMAAQTLKVSREELLKVAEAAERDHLTAAQRSADSLAAFRQLTNTESHG